MRAARRLCGLGFVAAVLALVWGASTARGQSELGLTVRLDGQDVSESSRADPIEIGGPVVLELEVTNQGDEPVVAETVRLSGALLGATVFAQETVIGMELEPGATQERVLRLDLSGAADSAAGLFPGSASVLDADRETLASVDVVWLVEGSALSLYGLFTLALLVLTGVLVFLAFRDLAAGRLSRNRWWRAVRFALVGVTAGITLAVLLGLLQVAVPTVALISTLLVVFTVAGLVIGYLTPAPPDVETYGDDELDEELQATAGEEVEEGEEEAAVPAPAPASSRATRASTGATDEPEQPIDPRGTVQ